MRPRRDIASGTPAHRVLSCEPSGAPPVRAASCFGRNPAARQSQRGFSLSYAAVRHLLPAGVADASATCGAGLCRRYQELQRISRKAPKQSACPWLAPPLRAARMRRSTEVIIPCAAALRATECAAASGAPRLGCSDVICTQVSSFFCALRAALMRHAHWCALVASPSALRATLFPR